MPKGSPPVWKRPSRAAPWRSTSATASRGVDQDGIDKDAEASTLRSRITATSGAIHGFTILGEADNVSVGRIYRYNSTVNDKTQYPVVADPKGTESTGLPANCRRLGYRIYGRQRINYSNQRFVGGVAPGARMSSRLTVSSRLAGY